jgi:hypothetical protein
MKERLTRAEIRKDALQNTVEAAAGTVEQVASIVTAAVKDVAGAVGGFATELFEIRDAARRASADHAEELPELLPDPDAASSAADSAVHRDPDAPTG